MLDTGGRAKCQAGEKKEGDVRQKTLVREKTRGFECNAGK
jgi:hypothetical protein